MKTPRGSGPRKVDPKTRQEAATALAITALSFVAADPEHLGRFLSLTGIGPESIRAAARQPGFLLGVLDYVAGDEAMLLAFANQNDFDPEDVQRARAALADGEVT